MDLQEGTAFFPGSSLAGNGLLVSDGPLWRRQRQLSNPAFRRAAIDSYAQVCMSIVLASLSKKVLNLLIKATVPVEHMWDAAVARNDMRH